MSFTSRRFVPRLEALDGRWLPAVTYDLVGSTLLVHGDAGANSITITDDGTATGVQVNGDGSVFPTGTEISAIAVDTLGGDDTVVYDLTGTLSVTRLVSVDLGRGADTFTADLHGNTVTGTATNMGISAFGDGGGDTLVLNAVGATVDAGATLNVDFHGQAGKDTITFNYDAGFLDLGNVILTKDQRH